MPSLRSRLSISPTLVGLFAFLFIWSLTTHGKFSASGDEPHYLMLTQSLVADGDIDVSNNYADNDGRLFGHAGVEMGRTRGSIAGVASSRSTTSDCPCCWCCPTRSPDRSPV